MVNASANPGQTVVVSIVLESLGNEASTSFSLNFNPAVTTNPVVALGSGVPAGSNLSTNMSNAGQGVIGILVDSINLYTAGSRQVVTVTFTIPANAQIGTYPVTFGVTPTLQSTSNTAGVLLPVVYTSGFVQIGSTASGVEVSGLVVTADGRGVRNALVTITDQSGAVRTATTGSFGYYRIEDIEAGATLIIGVSSKRYRYASRVVQAFDTLADVDFVGLE